MRRMTTPRVDTRLVPMGGYIVLPRLVVNEDHMLSPVDYFYDFIDGLGREYRECFSRGIEAFHELPRVIQVTHSTGHVEDQITNGGYAQLFYNSHNHLWVVPEAIRSYVLIDRKSVV